MSPLGITVYDGSILSICFKYLRTAHMPPRAVCEPTPPPCAIFYGPSSGERVFDMTGARQLKPMDMMAVLTGSGEPKIRAGDVGAIVELLPPDGLEIEFLGRDGRTRHIARSPPATCLFSITSGRASPDDAGAHSRAAPSGDFVLRDGRGSARIYARMFGENGDEYDDLFASDPAVCSPGQDATGCLARRPLARQNRGPAGRSCSLRSSTSCYNPIDLVQSRHRDPNRISADEPCRRVSLTKSG